MMYNKDRTVKGRLRKANIRVVTHTLSPEFSCVYVIPIGDCQIGSPDFDENALQNYIKWILERSNAFVVLMGDIIETPTAGDKASDLWRQPLSPQEARDKAADVLSPLKGRILGAVDGNHEHRAYKLKGDHVNLDLLKDIGYSREEALFLYDPDALALRLVFGTDGSYSRKAARPFIYTGYITHGWGGARRSGGQINKVEELSAVVQNADFYVIGHEHTEVVSRYDSAYIPQTGDDCLIQRHLFVVGGCFCKYSSFQKRIARRMPNIGAPRIRLEGISGHRGHKDIHIDI